MRRHGASPGHGVVVAVDLYNRIARSLRACLRTYAAWGWVVARWRARRRVITMIMAQ